MIREWCEKNAHMLEHLSPIDIVIAWEEYRQRTDLNVEDQLRNIQFRIVCVQNTAGKRQRELLRAYQENIDLKQEIKKLTNERD